MLAATHRVIVIAERVESSPEHPGLLLLCQRIHLSYSGEPPTSLNALQRTARRAHLDAQRLVNGESRTPFQASDTHP